MKRKKINIEIPKDVILIHNIFKENKIKLFLVGGCIRDNLLNIKPKDWDLVSEAIPSKVIEMFKNKSFIKNILFIGESFGVISLVTENDTFEIATFRSDGEYTNKGRRPDSVTFGDIVEDSKRRDVTINALFYDIDTNEVVDLVGGVNDLKNGVVRTVGAAEDRFGEDRLRILRAIRFAGRFGSQLDPETDDALKKDASLEGISGERIRDEFLKGIASAKSVKNFLKMVDGYGLFDWVFKGLAVDKNFVEDNEPIIVIANMLKKNNIESLRKDLNNLKYSTDEVKAISFLIGLIKLSTETAVLLKRAQKNGGVTPEQVKKFGKLVGIDSRLLDTFIKFELSVSGPDLMDKMNLRPGPELGQAIQKVETDNFKELLG